MTGKQAARRIESALKRHAAFYDRNPELAAVERGKVAALRSGRATVKFWTADDAFKDAENNPIAIVARMIPRVNLNTKGERICSKKRKKEYGGSVEADSAQQR